MRESLIQPYNTPYITRVGKIVTITEEVLLFAVDQKKDKDLVGSFFRGDNGLIYYSDGKVFSPNWMNDEKLLELENNEDLVYCIGR